MSYLPITESDDSNYWGFWGTIGFGFFALAVFAILQTVLIFVYALWLGELDLEQLKSGGGASQELLDNIAYNGDLISLAEIPAAAIGILLIIQFINKKN